MAQLKWIMSPSVRKETTNMIETPHANNASESLELWDWWLPSEDAWAPRGRFYSGIFALHSSEVAQHVLHPKCSCAPAELVHRVGHHDGVLFLRLSVSLGLS